MKPFEIEGLSSPLFAKSIKNKGAVIIPFGCLEAHGPHLPLGSDTIQVEAVASKVAERMNILKAPVVPYGVCVSTRDHPGTVGITTGTLKKILRDLVKSLRRHGIHTFVIISGHAGKSHIAALRDAAENLIQEDSSIKVALISEYDLIREKGSDILETAEDRHAGELETSRVSYLEPDLVRGNAPEEYPGWSPYILSADKLSRWPGSVWGNPGAADPDKGRLLLERSVEEICSVIRQMIAE